MMISRVDVSALFFDSGYIAYLSLTVIPFFLWIQSFVQSMRPQNLFCDASMKFVLFHDLLKLVPIMFFLYLPPNPILYVDPDGNAGKRFHSQARQYMKSYMPIENAVSSMFTPDTIILPAIIDKNGNIIVPEREAPLIIYGGSVSKFGKVLGHL